MANVRKKNVIFVDSTGTITVDAIKPVIYGIMVTPSADASRVVVKESVSGTIVIDVKIAVTETRYLDFNDFSGIEVTGSFEISTLTNITSVLLYGNWLAPVGRVR